MPPPLLPIPARTLLLLALALSAGTALSLGLSRFAYALLLPPMRADLQWSYATAGLMNTSNALGYFLGAISLPLLLRRSNAAQVFVWGCAAATGALWVSGFLRDTPLWLVQRCAAGVFSAWVFMAGGILVARLGSESPSQSGLLIGVYYGGVGLGIIGASLSVPWVVQAAHWSWGWWVLTGLAAAASWAVLWPARRIAPLLHRTQAAQAAQALPWRQLMPSLLGYTCFGFGYIGYMTFIIADLREQGASTAAVAAFYASLGAGVVVSGRLWAQLLTRHTDGRPMAVLNGLLGLAVMLAALRLGWLGSWVSGVLFGSVFLSVVASTTALVRHQLPQAQWTLGITAFTVVFAIGQVAGPSVVGWIADGQGSLAQGFWVSALVLWVGAACALKQRDPPH